MSAVTAALPIHERVWQLVANGAVLYADASIANSGLVDGLTVTALTKLKPVPKVLKNRRNQATASLKADGSVLAWGSPFYGGDCFSVQDQLFSNVESIYSAKGGAFAALKEDGSVVAWGSANNGGDCRQIQDQLVSGVRSIFSTHHAFSALKED